MCQNCHTSTPLAYTPMKSTREKAVGFRFSLRRAISRAMSETLRQLFDIINVNHSCPWFLYGPFPPLNANAPCRSKNRVFDSQRPSPRQSFRYFVHGVSPASRLNRPPLDAVRVQEPPQIRRSIVGEGKGRVADQCFTARTVFSGTSTFSCA